jgi:predicted Zn-dependent protease
MKNEGELAGVLGHEITHITDKHTVNAIKREKAVNMGGEAAGSGGGLRDQFIARMSAAAFNKVFRGEFSQGDENDADKGGTIVANKVGYIPHGIADVLKKIEARNADRQDRNGMFASHPSIKERLDNNEKLIKSEKLSGTAVAEARYKSYITFNAKPVTEIATSEEGAAGLASGEKKKGDDPKAADTKKAEEPKKKGGFGIPGTGGSKQQASTQQASSAGARGGVPDRDAKGGPNKNPLGVKISAAELATFKKGIAG